MLRIVIDGLECGPHGGVNAKRMSGIRVSVVMREVATRDLEANLVAGQEDVAGRPNIDPVFVYLARRDGRRSL